jgi:ribosomal protein S18 acetylase RimI-like enzyme
MNTNEIVYRENPAPSDIDSVKNIVTSSGFFSREEVELSAELIQERLTKGEASGYSFLFAEVDGRIVGYTCYGAIPCTKDSYDLYWIAVHDDFRGRGIGRGLLARTERNIAKMGGKRVYVDTSSREQYRPTRSFYRASGYEQEAVLKDFYSLGDDKIIYVKLLK